MTDFTPEQIAEMKAVAEAATPAELRQYMRANYPTMGKGGKALIETAAAVWDGQLALLAHVNALREALEAADDTFDQVLDDMRGEGLSVCRAVKNDATLGETK